MKREINTSLIERLKLVIEINDILKKKGVTVLHPFLIADSGMGKSAIVRSLFPEVYIVDLQFVLKEDLAGVPVVKNNRVVYLEPEWIKSRVVFFDEFDKARQEIQSVVLSLLTNYRLLDHDLTDKIFIFASQPDFLLLSDEYDDLSRALLTRFVFLPLTGKESWEYVRERGFRKTSEYMLEQLNGKEKKLLEFRLSADTINPRVVHYVGEFTKELKNRFEREKAKSLLYEIFWYIPSSVLESIMDDCYPSIDTLSEEELVLLFSQMNEYELVEILPSVQHKLPARDFYINFARVYLNSSVDERSKLFETLSENIKKIEEFTKDDAPVVAYWHLVCFIVLSEIMDENDFFLNWLREDFYKEGWEGEKLREDVEKFKEEIRNE